MLLLVVQVGPRHLHVSQDRPIRGAHVGRDWRGARDRRHRGHGGIIARTPCPRRRHPPVVRHRVLQPRHRHARAGNRQVLEAGDVGARGRLHDHIVQRHVDNLGEAELDLGGL